MTMQYHIGIMLLSEALSLVAMLSFVYEVLPSSAHFPSDNQHLVPVQEPNDFFFFV